MSNRKFTNTQLNVLSKRVHEEIYKKTITDKKRKWLEEDLYRKIDFQSAFELVDLIEKKKQEIKTLEVAIKEIQAELVTILDYKGNQWNVPSTMEQVRIFFNSNIDKEVNKIIPSLQQIEAEILIASINGSADFMDEIIKKFTNENKD